jgi:hypothetical protein
MNMGNTREVAIGATLHCITGCSIGEILGLIAGTAIGLSNLTTLVLSTGLAFLIGYSLSIMPLIKSGLSLRAAIPIVLLADSLSILSMELADNAVMAIIPGAMNAGLVNPLFWATMPISLIIAFFVAVPVNEYLLKRGKGHALSHCAMGHEEHA